ncbi:MAG: prevent-host-death protein [Faecalibacterium sp.]
MPHIRPITDLRKTTEISDLCHAQNEPIFITKNGYGDLVVMSVETYEIMRLESVIDVEIEKAENAYLDDGLMLDAATSFDKLRRKHFVAV